MISINVTGILVAKPYVEHIGDGGGRRCEFTVFDLRRIRVSGQWQPVWERVVFVAWDGEADRVALIMDKGANVSCIGMQETHYWIGPRGERRLSVKYRLTAWSINYRQRCPCPGAAVAARRDATGAPPSAAVGIGHETGRAEPKPDAEPSGTEVLH
jgi:single-stranded DNA-binding protein